MLETLGLEFEGRPHCGLDDAQNIARILLVLMEENAPLHVNERLLLKHYRSREKALLASATATVQKRTDGMGELVSSCAYLLRYFHVINDISEDSLLLFSSFTARET